MTHPFISQSVRGLRGTFVLMTLAASALLSACGGGGGDDPAAPPPAVQPPAVAPDTAPAVPTALRMGYGVNSFKLEWAAVGAPEGGGAVTYKLFEDPDGAGPQAPAQIGGALANPNYTQVVTGLLPTRLNAQYQVQACNTLGCSALTAAITPDLTQAIGYFKASNTKTQSGFGYVLALSADANTLAVGAVGESSNATGINGDQANASLKTAGAVYVFTRSASGWSQQAYVKASNTDAGDAFGASVALSADGNTLAVGALGEASSAAAVNGNQGDNSAVGAGAVYVFTRIGIAWSQQAYVKASNAGAGDQFGVAIALSTEGNTLAVGAEDEAGSATGINGQANDGAEEAGAAYVFTRNGTIWSQQAYLKASNTGKGDNFGASLAMSQDGNLLAVGATREDSNAKGINGDQVNNDANGSGAVYVFVRNDAAWSQQTYVKASNTVTDAKFGSSVALSALGNTMAVGARNEDSNATGINGDQANRALESSGAVYAFTRSGVTWTQQAYLKASASDAGDYFGFSVALSADGNALAVGAIGEASGAVGINGNQGDNSVFLAGAVYGFSRSAGNWSQQAYLKASNAAAAFGASVALSADGKALAVGAYGENSNATGIQGDQSNKNAEGAGAVYLY